MVSILEKYLTILKTLRVEVASSPTNTPVLFYLLAHDPDDTVRASLVRNPAITESALNVLYYDRNLEIEREARDVCRAKNFEIPQQFPKDREITSNYFGRFFTIFMNESPYYSVNTINFSNASMDISELIEKSANRFQVDLENYLRFLWDNSEANPVRQQAGLMLYNLLKNKPQRQQQQVLLPPRPSAEAKKARKTSGLKIGRPADPEGTINRLLEKYRTAAAQFSRQPAESAKRLKLAHTLINAFNALRKRAYDTEKLPHRDLVTEAHRIKRARSRARAKELTKSPLS